MDASILLTIPISEDGMTDIWIDVDYEVCRDVGAPCSHPADIAVTVPEELENNNYAIKWLHSSETNDLIYELLKGEV